MLLGAAMQVVIDIVHEAFRRGHIASLISGAGATLQVLSRGEVMTVALSEHEQRLLEEMERNLYRSDTDVVAPQRLHAGLPSRRGVILGSLIILVGIGVLIGGVVTGLIVLGVFGFAVMFGGVLYALLPRRSRPVAHDDDDRTGPPVGVPGRSAGESTLEQRMQQRWERRQQPRD